MTETSDFRNPYVGPRSFDVDERSIFFGRDEEIAILVGQVMARRVSLFFAQSGAGKSSLLRAGLIPELTREIEVGQGRRRHRYRKMRVLPILRRINTFHLLVVVFFDNTEIRDFAEARVETLEDIYHQTIARKFLTEKSQMVQKLQQYGIQAILTRPEDLSINTVNKYLELKSRGLI